MFDAIVRAVAVRPLIATLDILAAILVVSPAHKDGRQENGPQHQQQKADADTHGQYALNDSWKEVANIDLAYRSGAASAEHTLSQLP